MSESEFVLLFSVLACIGGGWGARRSGQPFWKGFLIIVLAAAASELLLLLIASESAILSILIALVTAGVAGGAMKMTGRQISLVILGSIVILIPALVIAEMVDR
ncbi:hypothetical protein AAIH46_17875 [Rhizobium sp. 0TCS1.26]|uniref:hypothetical protein n=1 Tax=Rhizobium sp. 0TCS1.26 TaxID=3142623 RepID=UPI003D27825A